MEVNSCHFVNELTQQWGIIATVIFLYLIGLQGQIHNFYPHKVVRMDSTATACLGPT